MKSICIVAMLLALLLGIASSFFVVREGEVALLIRSGSIVQNITNKTNEPEGRNIVAQPKERSDAGLGEDANFGGVLQLQPGLHWRLPFFTSVKKIDQRSQALLVRGVGLSTPTGQLLNLNYSVHWSVIAPEKYLLKFAADSKTVASFVQPLIDSLLDVNYGKLTLQEIMLGKNGDLANKMVVLLNQHLLNSGINVNDFSIMAVNLTPQVRAAILIGTDNKARHIAPDSLIKTSYQAELTKKEADQAAAQLLAEAKLKAAEILAAGQKEAALLYLPMQPTARAQ